MRYRPGRALGVLAVLALAACEQVQSLNPLAGLEMPSLGLDGFEMPSLGLDIPEANVALADLLPEMAYGRGAAPRVDGPNGGFPGEVAPLAGDAPPLVLARDADLAFATRVFAEGRDYAVRGAGALTAVADDRLWQLDVLTFEDRRRRLASVTPPLVSVRMTTGADGRAGGLVMDFPAFAARGARLPDRDSGEYEALAGSLRYLVQPLAGERGTIGRPAALARLLRGAPAPVSDTTAGRIVGTTRLGERDAWVAVFDGEAVLELRDDRLVYRTLGHAVIDRATGLTLRSVVQIDRAGRVDGTGIADTVLIETQIRPRAGAGGA